MDIASLAIVFVCLALGGILKGATGAGAPVLAVPAIATLFDVRFAVVVMMVSNLFTNLVQWWRFREHRLPLSFDLGFCGAGVAGVLLGTMALASLSPEVLSLGVGVSVLVYIAFRLARPGWFVPYESARILSVPAGFGAGLMQGASGLSAPISLTFLNAMRLERPVFIATVSAYFAVITVPQVPALAAFGILTWQGLAISALATIPIAGFMPVGAWLARHISREVFDRAILVLLAVLALKLIADALL